MGFHEAAPAASSGCCLCCRTQEAGIMIPGERRPPPVPSHLPAAPHKLLSAIIPWRTFLGFTLHVTSAYALPLFMLYKATFVFALCWAAYAGSALELCICTCYLLTLLLCSQLCVRSQQLT